VRISARRAIAVCSLLAVAVSTLPATAATAGVNAGIPSLSLNRAYTTAPFAGTTTTMNGQEGSAYVPADNALWLVDTTRAYEVDASTDARRRTIATADFTNALPIGGVGAPAGTTRSDSFAGLAYDPTADALYVFSRNCCTATGLDPSVFRLKRDLSGAFQVESYQSLPAGTDPKAAGYKAGTGLFFGKGAKINPYDYDTNTIGATITIPAIDAAVQGMAFSPDGAYLYATTFVAAVAPDPASIKLYKIDTSTWTKANNWTLDLAPFGVLDARSVEVIGDQIYIGDGGTRAAGDPLRRAIFVFDVNDLSVQPAASFTATPTSGSFPLPVQFTDTSAGGPTSWAWDFGDGGTSNQANPAHTYAAEGTYTVKVTVSNSKGTDTSTTTDLVTVTAHAPVAGFTATPTSGTGPLNVAFTDTSANQPSSWAWSFGDGATSTAQNPSHSYAAAGNYPVSLTVTNSGGSNTRVRSDLVHVGNGPTTVTAAADTYVRSDAATTNYGTQTSIQGLKSGNGAKAVTYLPYVRFTVPALPATPASAKLRLFVTDASAATGALFATSSTFPETTTNYNNRPATTGSQIAASKAATLGQWVEFDVTAQVPGAGAYGFTLTNQNSDAVAFSSREGANPPQLVFTYPAATASTGLPNPPNVGLRLNHQFSTSPFPGTTTSAAGEGGTAWIPTDNALWLTDGTKAYELDATTSALRRTVPTADFTNALPVGGAGSPAGTTRSDALAAMTYDPATDTLYAFSRNCCTATGLDPSAFRMKRDGTGTFQVESYQALPAGTDPVAAGVRPGAGLYFGKGQTILPYDYATNTIGTGIVIPGVDTAISGMHFTTDGKDLLVTSHLNVLYRVSTTTWTVVPNWSFDLSQYGFVDPRGVALVGDQLFVVDGGLRPVGDPLRYAMFVFDIVDASGAPAASFTASPTTGTAPVATTFIDRSTGVPTAWIWDFGDGSTSTVARPTHTYTTQGVYTVTLTVTNAQGTASSTQTDLVNVAQNPPLLNAKFSGSPTSGGAPLPVQFTDASVGGVTGWAWDFGDGATSTEQNPAHTYVANGKYTVKLTVTGPSGTNTRIRTDYVTVAAPPTTVTPAADTYVRSDTSSTNYGTQTSLLGYRSGNGGNAQVRQPYVRFTVPSLLAPRVSATLRLFVTDASATSGTLFRTATTTWTETGTTYNNRPTTTGAALGGSRNAPLGQWIEFDVTSTVTGAGSFGFTLTNGSTDQVGFSSKEGANAPQLLISYTSGPIGSLPLPATPGLARSRFFTTSTFSGTNPAIRAFDLEGSAYVPSDDALWLSDDNGDRVFEVDATASTVRRALQREEFANALPPGGVGSPAGLTRTDDFESIAYDATNDTLYQFSGNCCSSTPNTTQPPYDPTIYRLKRDSGGRFQVESYQALPEGTDPTGSGWRPGVGLYFAHGGIVTSYDYATNTLGTPTAITGTVPGNITGMTYTPDGKYIIAVTGTQRLILVDATTLTLVPGWNIDLRPFGILDSRAVEFIDGQLFVSDGYDFRAPDDPMKYAVFVFDVVNGPPNATFTATPTSGTVPLSVQFADTTYGTVTSRVWNFGDGSPTSAAANPSHVYSAVGLYTASLTTTNANGSNTATQVINVVAPPVTVTAAADTYARSNAVNTNYGTQTTMQGFQQTGTQYQPYFRFSVGALPATPVSATVRLFVTDPSNTSGNLYQTANATWTETGLTWNTRPATTGSVLFGTQQAALGQWVEFDVTPLVTGPGEYSFTLTGASADAVAYSTRQGTNPPQLVISFV
jgi:PKD repeat protein